MCACVGLCASLFWLFLCCRAWELGGATWMSFGGATTGNGTDQASRLSDRADSCAQFHESLIELTRVVRFEKRSHPMAQFILTAFVLSGFCDGVITKEYSDNVSIDGQGGSTKADGTHGGGGVRADSR